MTERLRKILFCGWMHRDPVSYTHLDVYKRHIKEQLIFPEVEYDKVDKVRGMDIIFVTTAKTDEEARELLTLFNMPFAK